MSKLTNIFGKSQYVEGIGEIYPIKVSEWEEFSEYCTILQLKKEHFTKGKPTEMKHLEVLFTQNEIMIIHALKQTLKMALHIEHDMFDPFANGETGRLGFAITEGEKFKIIDQDNFDEIRRIILNQNLLIEPRVFKNKYIEESYEAWLKTQSGKGVEITFEAKLTTVAAWEGKRPKDYLDYTYYELEAIFQRINKFFEFTSQSMMLANPYADPSSMKMIHFAESINLYRDPSEEFDKGIDLKTLKESVN